MNHELPQTVRIARIIDEAKDLKTLLLPLRLDAKPGQFIMLWLPGVDAKPVGVCHQDKHFMGATVCAVGPWSKKVIQLRQGDLLGVLGPYGKGFELQGKHVALVGGGYGTASLMLLAEEAHNQKVQVTMIVGAKSEPYLPYRKRLQRLGIDVVYTTDDGSYGKAGFTTEALADLLKAESIDCVYACGPELMETKVFKLCQKAKLPCQISLERYMKCGFGICGACCVDPSGHRVCVEGPVFRGKELAKIAEFGEYHRDATATKHSFANH